MSSLGLRSPVQRVSFSVIYKAPVGHEGEQQGRYQSNHCKDKMIVEKERSGPRTYVGVELAGLTDGLDGRMGNRENNSEP